MEDEEGDALGTHRVMEKKGRGRKTEGELEWERES